MIWQTIMMQETISVRKKFSESEKYAINDEIIVRARQLALKFARAFGSRREPKAHDVPRKENFIFNAWIIMIFLSLTNTLKILKNGTEITRQVQKTFEKNRDRTSRGASDAIEESRKRSKIWSQGSHATLANVK